MRRAGAIMETLKTIGIILLTAGVALVVTWPLARVLMPPQKGGDI